MKVYCFVLSLLVFGGAIAQTTPTDKYAKDVSTGINYPLNAFSNEEGMPNFIIELSVIDKQSGLPLARASVTLNNSLIFTNDSGKVRFESSLPIMIKISYVGYVEQTITIKSTKKLVVEVKMIAASKELSTINVLPQLPQFLHFGSRETQVIDYLFIQNYLVVAMYNYVQKKCYAVVLNNTNEMVAEYDLPINFERFYVSGIYKIYAISGNSIHEIEFKKGALNLKYINHYYFFDKVVYYVGYLNNHYFIRSTDKTQLANVYYIEEVNDTSKGIEEFYASFDMQDVYKYTAHMKKNTRLKGTEVASRKGNAEMIDDESTKGWHERETSGEFIRMTNLRTEFKENPSQLIVEDTTVCVFDYIQSKKVVFNSRGQKLSDTTITLTQLEGWDKSVVRSQGEYYTSQTDKEQLVTISKLDNGSCGVLQSKKLAYPAISNWKVKDGYVYYLGSTKDYPNNVFLFKEVFK